MLLLPLIPAMKTTALLAALTLSAAAGPLPPAALETAPAFRLFDGLQRLDADTELLDGGGISVLRSSVSYEQQRGDWTFHLGSAVSTTAIDYEPTIVTFPADRREETWELSAEASRSISEEWEVSLGARYYDGFSDYRSLWIAEYYDQFTGFLSGYETADPRGLSADLGVTWEYLPRTAKLTAGVSFGRDHIVPAWSPLGETVERTRDSLDSLSASLRWEAALSPRVKMEHTLRLTDTTGRDLRWQSRSEIAWAATDRLTLRAEAGGALEDPTFEALFGGISMEYAFTENWRAGLTARIYDDTGELESANFNTAAPGVTSRELSAHLLWTKGTTSVRLSAGVLEADYEGLSDDNLFFGNLYRDRDFLTARLAVTHAF